MTGVDDLAGLPVVVTGGCGFVGTNLVEALVGEGARIGVVDLPGADWSRMPAGVVRMEADLLDGPGLRTALAGFEAPAIVYHLAARTDLDGRTLADYAVNTTGTDNLIAAIAERGAVRRFVHYSTQLVAGLFDESRFIDETEPFRTTTVYGDSKVESEKVVRARCDALGIAWTIVRPTSVYGPWGAAPYREFFAQIRRGRYLHVGRAANLVSLVYVENLVDLTLLLGCHDGAAGEVFFANDFHPYPMRQVVDVAAAHYGVRIRTAPVWLLVLAAYTLGLFKAAGAPVPLYPFRLRNMRMTYCYDIRKSVRLGYDPRFGLEDGIGRTVRWYDAHPAFADGKGG
jgi:nucleoside-diphosphate-sugar epimerase